MNSKETNFRNIYRVVFFVVLLAVVIALVVIFGNDRPSEPITFRAPSYATYRGIMDQAELELDIEYRAYLEGADKALVSVDLGENKWLPVGAFVPFSSLEFTDDIIESWGQYCDLLGEDYFDLKSRQFVIKANISSDSEKLFQYCQSQLPQILAYVVTAERGDGDLIITIEQMYLSVKLKDYKE